MLYSSEKGDYIKAKFPEFEYVIVEDLEQENAFDDAVKGVDAMWVHSFQFAERF